MTSVAGRGSGSGRTWSPTSGGAATKLSEFRRAVDEEFGEQHGRILTRELVIDELAGRTADLALQDGYPIDTVWQALCRANEVPRERWYGRGLRAEQR